MHVVSLSGQSFDPDRPFTDPSGTESDIRYLYQMLNGLREVLSLRFFEIDDPAQKIEQGDLPLDLTILDDEGNESRTLIYNVTDLNNEAEFQVVGFFGKRSLNVSEEVVEQVFSVNEEVVKSAATPRSARTRA